MFQCSISRSHKTGMTVFMFQCSISRSHKTGMTVYMSEVGCWFEPRLGLTKDYEIGI